VSPAFALPTRAIASQRNLDATETFGAADLKNDHQIAANAGKS
jgi:hypothetical protein